MFGKMPMEEIHAIILQNSRNSEVAMYYLLKVRMIDKLRKTYQYQKSAVSTDFEDMVSEFMIYLRDGKYGKNMVRFYDLHRMKNPKALGSWIMTSFRFFLINYSQKEKAVDTVSLEEMPPRKVNEIPDEEWLSRERRIRMAAYVIAYTHQTIDNLKRLIFLRWMMGYYKKDGMNNREMAMLLGMTYISYRVMLNRIKKLIARSLGELSRLGSLPLDGEHLRMKEFLISNFDNLYPYLEKQYKMCLFIETGQMF